MGCSFMVSMDRDGLQAGVVASLTTLTTCTKTCSRRHLLRMADGGCSPFAVLPAAVEQRGVQQFSRYGTGLRQIKNTDPVGVQQAASPDWRSTPTLGHDAERFCPQPITLVIRAALKVSLPARLID